MNTDGQLQVLSQSPRVAEIRGMLGTDAVTNLQTRLADRHWLAGQRIPVRQDVTGTSYEIPKVLLSPLREVCDALRRRFEMKTADVMSVRIRDYREGNSHGPHCDHYTIDGRLLLQTALLYLTTPEAGGETKFVRANPPLWVRPEANRLVTWLNYHPGGSPDYSAEHEAMAVTAGRKLVAIFLFYGAAREAESLHTVFDALSTAQGGGGQRA